MNPDNLQEALPTTKTYVCPLCEVPMELQRNYKGSRRYECPECYLRIYLETRRVRWALNMFSIGIYIATLGVVIGIVLGVSSEAMRHIH